MKLINKEYLKKMNTIKKYSKKFIGIQNQMISKNLKNLFNLVTEFYKDFSSTANDNNLKIRHYGSRKKLSKKLLSIKFKLDVFIV